MKPDIELVLLLPDHPRELRVLRLDGREAISRLFRFDLHVVSPGRDLAPTDAPVGSKATIIFRRDGKELRRVHGILSRTELWAVAQGPASNTDTDAGHGLRLRLVPRAARAKLITTQEIFLEQSVAEIIVGKLDLIKAGLVPGDRVPQAHGAAPPLGRHAAPRTYGLDLTKYPKRDFVVQYKESDFDFICRLAEDAGISFHFEHDGNADHIRLADATSGLANAAQAQEIRLSPHLNEPDRVHTFGSSRALVPGSHVVYDYNYRTAAEVIWPRRDDPPAPGLRPGTTFEYGSHAKDEDHAKAIHTVRMDEVRCREVRYKGTSSIPGMAAGGQTTLEAQDPAFDGTKLLITSVRHTIEPTASGETALVYRNSFRAVGVEHTYRPKRRTKRPRIGGIVTAVVQGLDGELEGTTPHLDKEGRYLVQFHFDWAAMPGQRASRWIRMAQPFNGKGNSVHFPLLPGSEVLVAFADGDPDRPIIIGAVANETSPTTIGASEAQMNRIESSKHVVIEFGEARGR